MACTLISRILHGTQLSRQSRLSNNPSTGSVDRGPDTHCTRSPLSLTKLKSTVLAAMKPQPLVSVIIYAVPAWLGETEIETFVKAVPDIVRVRFKKSNSRHSRLDLILDFEPGTDPYKSLNITADEACITINHMEFSVNVFPVNYDLTEVKIVSTIRHQPWRPDAVNSVTSRRVLKLSDLDMGSGECHFCCNEIEGPFSTPCWNCRNAQCYDCIKHHFQGALKDFQRFPAKCCEVAFHPDVAKGILPDDDHAKYKKRFEEWLTKEPLYCPVPTCSAFISPRLVRRLTSTTMKCHACQASICVTCKERAHVNRLCGNGNQQAEILEMMKKFGYKQCPRCGTAVGKMYGCSHLQCNCGAHWCWECQRKIEICNARPCDGARDAAEQDYDMWLDRESDIDSITETEDRHDMDYLIERSSNSSTSNGGAAGAVLTPSTTITPAAADTPVSSTHRLHEAKTENTAITPLTDNNHEQNSTHSTGSVPIELTSEAMPQASHSRNVANTVSERMSIQNILATSQSTEQAAAASAPTNNDAPGIATTTGDLNLGNPQTINLDDPSSVAWEYENIFFGEEPGDDDPLDIWGCVHEFEPATYNRVPRYWMTASIPDWWERDVSQRVVDCMMCWRPAKMAPKSIEIEVMDDGEEKRKRIKDWRFARRCVKCNLIVCRKCRNELVRSES